MKNWILVLFFIVFVIDMNAQNSRSKTNSKYYKPNASKVAEEKKKQENRNRIRVEPVLGAAKYMNKKR
jgi:hypothetical protein